MRHTVADITVKARGGGRETIRLRNRPEKEKERPLQRHRERGVGGGRTDEQTDWNGWTDGQAPREGTDTAKERKESAG